MGKLGRVAFEAESNKINGEIVEKLHQLEEIIASWHKDLPHLPENGRAWIARNIWWLTLVGVILGGIGASIVLMALVTGAVIMGFYGTFDPRISAATLLIAFVTLSFAVANMVVAGAAIAPLKPMRKSGWSLLFVASLINVVSLVVTFFFNYNLFGLVYGLLFAVVGVYFLFEIRGHFHEPRRAKKPAARKRAQKRE